MRLNSTMKKVVYALTTAAFLSGGARAMEQEEGAQIAMPAYSPSGEFNKLCLDARTATPQWCNPIGLNPWGKSGVFYADFGVKEPARSSVSAQLDNIRKHYGLGK